MASQSAQLYDDAKYTSNVHHWWWVLSLLLFSFSGVLSKLITFFSTVNYNICYNHLGWNVYFYVDLMGFGVYWLVPVLRPNYYGVNARLRHFLIAESMSFEGKAIVQDFPY